MKFILILEFACWDSGPGGGAGPHCEKQADVHHAPEAAAGLGADSAVQFHPRQPPGDGQGLRQGQRWAAKFLF